jgi:diguanylate cyclase (GGDEF)-like protein
MNNHKDKKTKTGYIFLIIYLPLFLISSVIIMTYYFNNNKTKLKSVKKNEFHYVNLLNEVVKRSFSEIISDLFIISNSNLISDKIFSSYHERILLALELYSFVKARKIYDQIRVIDTNGNEIVRVNYNDGSPEIVSEKELQNKRGRYYFENAINLKKSEIYISSFDLNMEHDQIEIPFRPVIRFAISIFNNYGEKIGIIVINYLGESILNDLKYINKKIARSTLFLINQKGYFLLNPNKNYEWSFMFKDKKQYVFKDFYPNAWQQISKNKNGQFLNEKGLFTYMTISLDNLTRRTTDLDFIRIRSSHFWKLISYYPRNDMENNEEIIKLPYLLSYLTLLAMFLMVPSILFAELIKNKIILNEKLKFNANYDKLTGLPNRNLFFDRLNIVLSYSERYQQKFALFYMDLDDFKTVNDNYGHEAGDEVLKEFSRRISQIVRKSDTFARLGGDEFILIIQNIKEISDLKKIAMQIIGLTEKPFKITESVSVSIGISIGISIYPYHGTEVKTILANADKVMYKSKQKGKNNFIICKI